jgi:alpha-tubulin suppressor-like RCC1 family protein
MIATRRTRLAIGLAVALASFGFSSCASATAPGIVAAWGDNVYGQLGNGTTTSSSTPATVTGIGGAGQLTGVVAVAGGGSHTLALRSDGSVVAWGYNTAGQLGDGTLANRSTPMPVKNVTGTGTLTGVVAVAAGGYHSLALRSDGSVVAWGYNGDGELGDRTLVSRATPELVQDVGGDRPLTGVVAIAAGYDNSIALRADGTVVAWGRYPGDGSPDRFRPVQVSGIAGAGTLSGVVAIAAGGEHSLALRSDGSVVAWGYNGQGELGDGSTTNRLTPGEVVGVGGIGTLGGVAAIAVGYTHSLALRSDGSAIAWGDNSTGQLGNPTATNSLAPVSVLGIGGSGTLTGVVSVAGGAAHSLALLSGGGIVAWGENSAGQLGNGTTARTSTPVPVLGIRGNGLLTGVVALAPEPYAEHSLAIQGAFASLSPPRIDFGSQLADTGSAARTVTLTNSGPAPLTISGETLTGPGATAFDRQGDSCAGTTLAAGRACQVALRFTPAATGTQSATLAFQTTAANTLAEVALTGTSQARPSPAPQSSPPQRPVLTALTLSPRSFRAAPAGPTALPAARLAYGTLLSYRDSQAAITTFSVQRPIVGTLKGRRCLRQPKRAKAKHKRCTLYPTLKRFTHADKPGVNSLRFTGRINERRLAPGRYRLLAIAQGGRRTSNPRLSSFQIKPECRRGHHVRRAS